MEGEKLIRNLVTV